jgi:predicted DNA-binding protein (MmcQ/YjbR family)
MVTTETFRQLCLSFSNAVEAPHFEATSFRVNGKIFATLHIDDAKACLKFSPNDQQQFCAIDKEIYPVPNKWGASGWTFININNIREELLMEALERAYKEIISPKKKK